MIWWVLGSLVIVETLFAYPGVGALLLTGIHRSDFPVLQAAMLLMVSAYVLVDLAAELLGAALRRRRLPGDGTPTSLPIPDPAL